MSESIKIRQLSFGTLFKILFNANLAVCFTLGVIMGMAALAGFDSVTWNGTPVHGAGGAVLGVIIVMILGGIIGTIGSVIGAFLLKVLGSLMPFQGVKIDS